MAVPPEPWWKSAAFYQIYPRSFCDTDGDGVGDLEGIRRHLEHLKWLGVDAIWVCPFYPSPMADFGYDVSDYCNVDPLFGTLDDFDRLLTDAHDAGLRVIVDWVPNHTSDRHPWFVESRSSRQNAKRDWYIWRDRPNNWKAAFGGDAWTFDETSGQWYLHLFLPQQPDLNWRNPEVVEAMHSTLRFWLDRGVDGFRIDVVQGLAKDPAFADDPPEELLPRSSTNDHPDTHGILRGVRQVADAYRGGRVLVGEVYLLETQKVARYFGDGDELHLAFDFTSLYEPWDAEAWRARIALVEQQLGAAGAWPTWTLSNHDNARHRSRYGGSEARGRAAAVLLLTLRGTPFLYAGEELGLEDAFIPPGRAVDPGGRDGCRAPIPWKPVPPHGWAADPWLPWPPEPQVRNPHSMRADPSSIAHLYRRLLVARRGSPALSLGAWEPLAGPAATLAYGRHHQGDRRVVAVNFGTQPAEISLDQTYVVEVSSDGFGEGEEWGGRVGPDTGVVLRPA